MKDLNDRTQWNTGSGRPNPTQESERPKTIANRDNGPVKFRIGENQAHNLATRKDA